MPTVSVNAVKPGNTVHPWTICLQPADDNDGVMFLADIMRRAGIDGSTDLKKARDTIKNQFLAAKTFNSAYKYTFRDTGDGHIPGGVLSADTDKKVWKLTGAAAR